MQLGVPALLVLAITTLVGILFGYLNRKAGTDDGKSLGPVALRANIKMHILTVMVVALVFWIWAVKICLTDHFDLGAFTFLLALGVSALSLGSELAHKKFMPAACWIVAANYLLGALLPLPGMLRVYCGVGVAWWVASGALARYLARELERQETQMVDEPYGKLPEA